MTPTTPTPPDMPEKLLELSRVACNVREMMGHYADFYLEAIVTGRADQWKKAVICYLELVGNNEAIERRNK